MKLHQRTVHTAAVGLTVAALATCGGNDKHSNSSNMIRRWPWTAVFAPPKRASRLIELLAMLPRYRHAVAIRLCSM
jgi:hypothetical protein